MASIRKSVWIRIGVILFAILLSGGLTVFGLFNIKNADQSTELAKTLHSTALDSEKAHYLFLEGLQSYISLGSEFKPKDYKNCVLGHFLYSDLSTYDTIYPELATLVEEIKPMHQRIHETADQILRSQEADSKRDLDLYGKQVKPDVTNLVAKLDDIIAKSKDISNMSAEKLASSIQMTLLSTGLGILITLFACFLMVRYIMPKVVDPLVEITKSSRKLAEGELDFEIDIGTNHNEVGVLAGSLNESVAQLRTYVTAIRVAMSKMASGDLTVQSSAAFKGEFRAIQVAIFDFEEAINDAFIQIKKASEQVAEASEQVSEGAQSLANGSLTQAASVQELADTVQDITGQIKKNTEHADNARVMAQEVGDSMLASNQKMNEMTEAMDEIGEHSQQISKIIKTIEDIAFQTNILALNAAVEAARAGSAGKGFAVVADEVSNLAAKSSQAARTTTKLIGDSIQSVENGVRIAKETAQLLTVSVAGARNVSATIEEISSESNRQSEAATVVLDGINQISAIVQSNSATAQESAATSEELNGQARVLREMVGRFKLKEQ